MGKLTEIILIQNYFLIFYFYLKPINSTVVEMPLELSYEPTTIGKLRYGIKRFSFDNQIIKLIEHLIYFHDFMSYRFMRVVEGSIDTMRSLGFTDFDTDDVKGIFFDTNLYLLLLTVFITSCHVRFCNNNLFIEIFCLLVPCFTCMFTCRCSLIFLPSNQTYNFGEVETQWQGILMMFKI